MSQLDVEFLESIRDLHNGNQKPSITKEIQDRYRENVFFRQIFKKSEWDQILLESKWNKESIEVVLRKHYGIGVEVPDWLKLWRQDNLTNEEYATLLKEVKKRFYDKEYSEFHEVLHIACILMDLSAKEYIKDSCEKIRDFTRIYLKSLEESLKSELGDSLYFPNTNLRDLLARGHSFYGEKDSADTKNLLSLTTELVENIKGVELKKLDNNLEGLLSSNPSDFAELVDPRNIYDSRLSLLRNTDHIKIIKELENHNAEFARKFFLSPLSSRYSCNKELLKQDAPWLKSLQDTMKTLEKTKLSTITLTQNWNHYMADYLEAIKKINESIPKITLPEIAPLELSTPPKAKDITESE